LSRDYVEAGKLTAAMAAKIMRGADPARIPIASVTKTKLILNLKSAQTTGLQLPPDLVKQAAEVIR
jgi:putative ABC transport system substrate-binding protein